MITSGCPNCGNAVFLFAGSCGRCGAPNRLRWGAFAAAGSLLLLIAGVGIAVLRWHAPVPAGDFSWLATAMDQCDVEAAKAPDTLHFLVVPMASSPSEDDEWRGKSLNDIGNAILLTQHNAFDGLKGGTLRISSERYEFNMRDEGTGAVYKWSPSVGVKKFLIPDAGQITQFKVQFKTAQKTDDANWGAAFMHRKGSCYWVNAIIGH